MSEAQDTLRNLYQVWRRPVHISTYLDETPTLWAKPEEDGDSILADEVDLADFGAQAVYADVPESELASAFSSGFGIQTSKPIWSSQKPVK